MSTKTKERLHVLVERLDDEQVEEALSYIEGLAGGRDTERLSQEDLAAVRRGIEDIRQGRFVTLEEYEQGKRR